MENIILMLKEILSRYNLKIYSLSEYIVLVFAFSITIRFIMTLFKSAAVRQGEADERDKDGNILDDKKDDNGKIIIERVFSKWGRKKVLWRLFFSWGHYAKLDDYFLPFILGLFELIAFPVFIVLGKWQIIGGWIVIKTAARWRAWEHSRTPYMRFLVGNILSIAASCILSLLIKKIV